MANLMKKAAIYSMFGKHYGDKLYKLLNECCDDEFCKETKTCLGISATGDKTKVLNQRGDWIDTVNYVEITHSVLLELIATNNLVKNTDYLITDYQTMYYQPDYDASGTLKPTLVFKTETTERLVVHATSTNTVSNIAYSLDYPKDKITYDVNITQAYDYSGTQLPQSIKGRIIERIDEWGNRTDYDHRTVKFIRYDDGTGNYTVINDNSNSSEEFLTFGSNYANGGIITDNYMNGFYYLRDDGGGEFNNIVILGDTAINNSITGMATNNTFSGSVNSNTFSGSVNSNTFSGDVSNNTFSGSVADNTFSGDVYRSTFSGSIGKNLFSGSLGKNLFSGDVSNNTFSGDVNNNTFSGDVSNNTFSGDVNNNTFSGHVNGNTFSGSVNSNIFSGSVDSNTFTHTSALQYTEFNGNISSKTISESLYPELFGADYKKEVFLASNSSVYYKYFDGITDTVTQIV